MNKKIDWVKVAKVHTLKADGGFSNTDIARKTRLHRRQVLRYLSYWDREDNPYKTETEEKDLTMSQHPLYKVWQGMMDRCYLKVTNSYNRYGGRGIIVCERWHDSKNFFEDMSDGYEPGLQIDRIDNDGDYTPENCRWVTRKENCRNRS